MATTGVPAERIGALLVAWNDGELQALDGIRQNAEANGYDASRPVGVEELDRLEPHLAAGALGALSVPDEAVIFPFTTPLTLATEAVLNGAELLVGVR